VRLSDCLTSLGASGAMGLARMGRKVIMFDSQKYRFNSTLGIRNTITGVRMIIMLTDR
jgi:hypothetical protein